MFNKVAFNHKTLVSAIKIMKEKSEKDHKEISNLLNENQELKIRAGISWEEMTPRPSFKKVNAAF